MGYWDRLGERDEEERRAVGLMEPTWRGAAAMVALAVCLELMVALAG